MSPPQHIEARGRDERSRKIFNTMPPVEALVYAASRRIPAAFSAGEAAAVCDVIWAALAKVGIHRDDPSTWTTARPVHLQHRLERNAIKERLQ